MNLEFNIAIHVLTFLTKHKDEKFNSKELAELTCLNPVQLRRVVSVLSDQHYITTMRGKGGGYQSNQHTASVNLATLYQQFVLNKESKHKFIPEIHLVIAIFLNILLTQCQTTTMKKFNLS